MENWAERKLMNFNKEKYKILHPGKNNWLEMSFADMNLRVLVDSKQSMNHKVPVQQRRLIASWTALGRSSPAG